MRRAGAVQDRTPDRRSSTGRPPRRGAAAPAAATSSPGSAPRCRRAACRRAEPRGDRARLRARAPIALGGEPRSTTVERVGRRRGRRPWPATDRLVDAARGCSESRLRARVDDGRRAAVVDLRASWWRAAGEVAVVVDEELGVGAGVAVDDLVVVADAEHVVAGRGDEPQQQQVGGREVLELVDEERAGLGPDLGPQRRASASSSLDRAVDLLVEVERGRRCGSSSR